MVKNLEKSGLDCPRPIHIPLLRCDSNLEIVSEDLQHDMKILLNWFQMNLIKPNPKKIQFMTLGKGSRLPANVK